MKLTSTKLVAACLVAFGMATNVYATAEVEDNHPLRKAQGLEEAASHSIQGMMGGMGEATTEDLDFYSFNASEGDVLNIVASKGPNSTISTIIVAVFDADGTLLRMGAGSPARIVDYTVNASGSYTIGVSSGLRFFMSGGDTMAFFGTSTDQMGEYSLNATGISPSVKQINIEVKPGRNELTPLNPRAKGKIPVAILGGAGFDVDEIKQKSLTFGQKGTEDSLYKCQKGSRDINRDGYADLLCHFENSAAGFQSGDIEGVLKGTMNGNIKFEGRAVLKVIPTRRK